MTPPLPPPDDREARLTAFLLGELSPEESAALRSELEQDAALRQLLERLEHTIGLVREAVAAPDLEPSVGAAAPQLAPERRESLLASFKVVPATPPSRFDQWRRTHWRECAALAAMLVALLLMAAVLTSNQLASRTALAYAKPTPGEVRDGPGGEFLSGLMMNGDVGVGGSAATTTDAEYQPTASGRDRGNLQLKVRSEGPSDGDRQGQPPASGNKVGDRWMVSGQVALPPSAPSETPARRLAASSSIALPTLSDDFTTALTSAREGETAGNNSQWFGNTPAPTDNWGVRAGARSADGRQLGEDLAKNDTKLNYAWRFNGNDSGMPTAGFGANSLDGTHVSEFFTTPPPAGAPAQTAGGGGGGGGLSGTEQRQQIEKSMLAGTTFNRLQKPAMRVESAVEEQVERGRRPAMPASDAQASVTDLAQSDKFYFEAGKPNMALNNFGQVLAGEPVSPAVANDPAAARTKQISDSTKAAPAVAINETVAHPVREHDGFVELAGRPTTPSLSPTPAPINPAPSRPAPTPAIATKLNSGLALDLATQPKALIKVPVAGDDLDVIVNAPSPTPSAQTGGGMVVFNNRVSANPPPPPATMPVPPPPQAPPIASPAAAAEPMVTFSLIGTNVSAPAQYAVRGTFLTNAATEFSAGFVTMNGNANPDLQGISAFGGTSLQRGDESRFGSLGFGDLQRNLSTLGKDTLNPNARYAIEGNAFGGGGVADQSGRSSGLGADGGGRVAVESKERFDKGITLATEADKKSGALGGRNPAARTLASETASPVADGLIDQSMSDRSKWESRVSDPADGEAQRALARVEIALPQGQRGDAIEKLRVASGPVARTVVMDDAANPATGLPAADFDLVDLPYHYVGRKFETPRSTAARVQTAEAERPAVRPDQPTDKSGVEDFGLVATEKSTGNSDLHRLKRELDSLNSVRDRLAAKIAQDELEAKIPREGVVVEKAEATKAEERSLGQRVRGFFDDSVSRSAKVAVEKQAPDSSGIGDTRTGIGAVRNGFDPYWIQTEAEKIQSKTVLAMAVEKLNLNTTWAETHGGGQPLKTVDAVKLLQKQIEVRGDGSVIDIRVKGDNAEEAARIANGVAEAYRDFRRALGDDRATNAVKVLRQELTLQEQKVAAIRQELERRTKAAASPPSSPAATADVPLPKLAAGAPTPQPDVAATDNAFSTFSLNVSDVSFKLAAASLEKGQMPEAASVRTEEFINAFDYRDPEPGGSAPIAFAWERARYPFAHDRDLVRFSVKTAASGRQPGRPLNLVLAIDNSGSMERADRVRILRECLRVLGTQLQAQDRVSVVTFARTAQLVRDGRPGSEGADLPAVADGTPQGGTNLEDAMNLAYQTARRHYLSNGVNRVVMLTDGAANLGDVQPENLKAKVEAQRRQGIALDCFGIGWEGYNDDLLEQLSRNGDGRYGFVNTPEAAASEFAGQLAGALKVAASDVKVQVEWNPRRVTTWRQIGYAKHQLKKEQFRDNTVDAAEIAAAEAGNALYTVQVNPAGEGPLGTVRVRFKVPGTSDYREHEWTLPYAGTARTLQESPATLRLAASAAAFSEWLVSSPFAAEVTPDKLLSYLNGIPEAWGVDARPKKLEWMIRQARSVSGK